LNESEIGAALGKVIGSFVKREELFIVGKLWNHSHQPDQVEERFSTKLVKIQGFIRNGPFQIKKSKMH